MTDDQANELAAADFGLDQHTEGDAHGVDQIRALEEALLGEALG
ncbi:hypothetical protein GCM10010124_02410 [Pilimelia terevasa]|uniref:Uncharacterized protein n=1 Tax=Pilimelia terevasa TaxID=53372 RepID=A0A8J3BGI9_9ACTN|nr:hypothetical protein [Pilimelia terevasa]GGK13390.1 hypothetical protein GCM10010124_02410 [Pilimelia terevasa]